MGIFDNLLGGSRGTGGFEPGAQGMLVNLTYDEIVAELGRGTRAKGGYTFWRKSLSDIDRNHDEMHCFQLSNYDYRGYGDAAKKPILETRETWFVVATSPEVIQILGRELGAMVKNLKSV